MAVGRYLATDTASHIGAFGDAIGDMRGDLISYEREKRLREALEARLKKQAEDSLRERDTRIGDLMLELSDMPEQRRNLVVDSLDQDTREGLGYSPGVPPLDMEVEPPSTPAAAEFGMAGGAGSTFDLAPPGQDSGFSPAPPRSARIQTPGAEPGDPFEGYVAPGPFEFMGGTYQTEDERNQAAKDYYSSITRSPNTSTSLRTPTDGAIDRVMRMSGGVQEGQYGQPDKILIPAHDYARIYNDVRNGRMSLEDIPTQVDSILDAHPPQDAGGPQIIDPNRERGDTRGVGQRLWEFGKGLLGFGDDEDEQPPASSYLPGTDWQMDPTNPGVQMQMPSRDSIRGRMPEGMRGPSDFGSDMGGGEDLPPSPYSHEQPSLGDLGPEDVAEPPLPGEMPMPGLEGPGVVPDGQNRATDPRAEQLEREYPAADQMQIEQFYELVRAARENGWSTEEIVDELMVSIGLNEEEARSIIAESGG